MSAVVRVVQLHPEATIPAYARPGDAGADLSSVDALTLAPGERALVATGIAIELPEGTVGLVHPRSGWAARHGITVLNAPGTVDSGYRGELKVNLINLDPTESAHIAVGDRIAQLVIQEVLPAQFVPTGRLSDSVRGSGGYGSTGVRSAPASLASTKD